MLWAWAFSLGSIQKLWHSTQNEVLKSCLTPFGFTSTMTMADENIILEVIPCWMLSHFRATPLTYDYSWAQSWHLLLSSRQHLQYIDGVQFFHKALSPERTYLSNCFLVMYTAVPLKYAPLTNSHPLHVARESMVLIKCLQNVTFSNGCYLSNTVIWIHMDTFCILYNILTWISHYLFIYSLIKYITSYIDTHRQS